MKDETLRIDKKEILQLIIDEKFDEAITRLLIESKTLEVPKNFRKFIKKPKPILKIWVRKNLDHFLNALTLGFLTNSLAYTFDDIENVYGTDFRKKFEFSIRKQYRRLKEKRFRNSKIVV